MSFLNNLGKSFIRSAVNQVGRDGGRLISNKVYGNRHAVSIRTVGSKSSNTTTISADNYADRQKLMKAGFKPELFSQNFINNALTFGGGFILPIAGPLYLLYISFRNFFKKKTRFYTTNKETVYVSDKRYKTGARPNGTRDIREYSKEGVIAISSERIIFISKGIIALLITMYAIYFQYSFYKSRTHNLTDNKVVTNEYKKGRVTANHGLHIRNGHSENSEIIFTVPFNDSVQIIDNNGPEATMKGKKANWCEIKYYEKTGWAWGGHIQQ